MQFVSVFSLDADISTAPDMVSSSHLTIIHIEVTQEGVYKLLSGLQVYTGPDEISSKILKELAEELTQILTHFFQASLDQERYQKTGNLQMWYRYSRKETETNQGIIYTDRYL